MPRRPRLDQSGLPQHVIQRGNNRNACFLSDEDYLLRVSRYIELNPVPANMVLHPRDYGWSSYACNGEGKVSDWLVAHPLYAALGETPAARAVTYAKMF